jgi:hypothetical protein
MIYNPFMLNLNVKDCKMKPKFINVSGVLLDRNIRINTDQIQMYYDHYEAGMESTRIKLIDGTIIDTPDQIALIDCQVFEIEV